jgi:hypothetical protein
MSVVPRVATANAMGSGISFCPDMGMIVIINESRIVFNHSFDKVKILQPCDVGRAGERGAIHAGYRTPSALFGAKAVTQAKAKATREALMPHSCELLACL